MVAVPFLEEDPRLVVRTLQLAAGHPAIAEVVAVAGAHKATNVAVAEAVSQLPTVEVVPQRRLGNLRSGKGDAINTAFEIFLSRPHLRRLHFYDSEIATFGPSWIDKAEAAGDLGYDAVRHYYPRSATDAMITWMVVRTAFALLWRDSELPWIQQPLSGELMFTRQAVEKVWADPFVRRQSDWGIDTALTYSSVAHGMSLYECYISEGKDHALYGTLADIKTMMLECLAAVQALRLAPPPSTVIHRVEYPHAVSPIIAEKLGFDIEASQVLLTSDWNRRQQDLLTTYFPPEMAAGVKAWQSWPDTSFLGEDMWNATLLTLLDKFVLGDADWEALAFRLWVGRVLHYTLRVAVRGHGFALSYLNDMIRRAIASG